jgi:hypothetical protein
MGIAEIVSLILGVLQFPKEMAQLLRMIRSTDAEKQQELIKNMLLEGENFKNSGRPTWGA